MRTVAKLADMRELRRSIAGSVGFVPTMGYLHQGHLSLVQRARQENVTVIASIYVNPTQFGPHDDLDAYPRDINRDLQLLKEEGTDIVFLPAGDEMYPSGYSTWVDVEKVTERLEGRARPGHFRGVATVVAKLFNIVQPTRAYFGQKDAQQAVVIRRMVIDLNLDMDIIVVPTVREEDGLAMSSRNIYLNARERQAAPVLYRSLMLAKRLWQEGDKDASRIRQSMTDFIGREPLALLDYVSIADAGTLEELQHIDRPALVSLAVHIGKARLIDNIILI